MGVIDNELKLKATRVLLAGGILLGISSEMGCEPESSDRLTASPKVEVPFSSPNSEKVVIADLGLAINRERWEQVLKKNPNIVNIPSIPSYAEWNLEGSQKNIFIGSLSKNFNVRANKNVAEFMFLSARMDNLPLDTYVFFTDSWLNTGTDHDGAAFTTIYSNKETQEKAIGINISLNAVSWVAFKLMEEGNIPFTVAANFVVSHIAAHEAGHGGAQFKALGREDNTAVPFNDPATHPQIDRFQETYINLFTKAAVEGRSDSALMFIIEPLEHLNLERHREKIMQEAIMLGLE